MRRILKQKDVSIYTNKLKNYLFWDSAINAKWDSVNRPILGVEKNIRCLMLSRNASFYNTIAKVIRGIIEIMAIPVKFIANI